MSPALTHMKDKVYVSPFEGCAKKGDILLTCTEMGGFILYRLIIRYGDSFYYKGDALNSCEGPLPIGHVIGKGFLQNS